MATSAISFRAVRKSYGDFHAVEKLDLEVKTGEFLVLLGPSGCGKSTILKMLAGIEAPSAGEIKVDGRLVNYTLPRDRNVAMVFQNYALYPHMTVFENVAYPLKSRRNSRVSRSEVPRLVKQAAEIVEISDQLGKHPEALSGGQRQRVALARAIVRNPAVFLMDEPLSNLDAQLRNTMRQQLIALHRRMGKATIYVTHDQLEAMTMADRIVVLNAGTVQQEGTPEEVFRKPANQFVAGFVGHPRMNFLEARSLGGSAVKIGDHAMETTASTAPPEARLTVGLRPSDARFHHGGENVISGHVLRSEFTGPDIFLTLDIGSGLKIEVRQTNDQRSSSEEALSVAFQPDDVHVFDKRGNRM
ncbi:MAG: ABC transporter ATP-binding protein [Rhodobacteraceae bacterium]|nr:ABC transporter ATP-binding protein [Paracoccaceae bacterium]